MNLKFSGFIKGDLYNHASWVGYNHIKSTSTKFFSVIKFNYLNEYI